MGLTWLTHGFAPSAGFQSLVLLPPNQRRTDYATFPIKRYCTNSCRYQVCQKMLMIIVLAAQTPSITQHPSEHTSGAPLLCKLRHHIHHLRRRWKDWKATAIIRAHNCSIRLPSGFTIYDNNIININILYIYVWVSSQLFSIVFWTLSVAFIMHFFSCLVQTCLCCVVRHIGREVWVNMGLGLGQ